MEKETKAGDATTTTQLGGMRYQHFMLEWISPVCELIMNRCKLMKHAWKYHDLIA